MNEALKDQPNRGLPMPTQTTPKQAFFARFALNHSDCSNEIRKQLYSASASKHFGKGARVQLYVDINILPKPRPEEIKVMVWLRDPPPGRPGETIVRTLDRSHKTWFVDRSCDLGNPQVYLLPEMFKDKVPETCFIEVDFLRCPGPS